MTFAHIRIENKKYKCMVLVVFMSREDLFSCSQCQINGILLEHCLKMLKSHEKI